MLLIQDKAGKVVGSLVDTGLYCSLELMGSRYVYADTLDSLAATIAKQGYNIKSV